GSDDRQPPAADDRRDDEEDGDERGSASEDGTGRDGRVHISVRGTDQQAAAAGGQRRVLVEPDARALQQQVDGAGDGELDARGLRDAHLPAVEAQRAVEVAGGDRGDGGEQHNGGGERERRLVERQLEQVERDVEPELRIGGARRGTVQPGEGQL